VRTKELYGSGFHVVEAAHQFGVAILHSGFQNFTITNQSERLLLCILLAKVVHQLWSKLVVIDYDLLMDAYHMLLQLY
jgi:hypothetical protein